MITRQLTLIWQVANLREVVMQTSGQFCDPNITLEV